MQNLIDIGANLTHDSFDADRAAVIGRAKEAGVTHMVITGADVPGSQAAWELTQQYPDYLSATAGVHPHHAKDWQADSADTLRALLAKPAVKAVGECGLDFFRNFSTHEQQEQVFIAQLELAVEHQLPVFLHQRDAHDPFIAILNDYLPRIPRAVAHCFTGTAQQAEEYLDMGLYIGVTGWICDERRGADLREAVKVIPADKLMIETDAPYLLPRDLRPKPKSRRNEPAYLPHILQVIADCRSEKADWLASQTNKNSCLFFNVH
ncbi:MAG TPA: TatD family hydrolase [Gammaproteobacteria bacterium]|nr:TatD family hydrolase [Gammaproteobacteria bacterium]